MKKSTTKRALLLSVLSMFLCFTMLVGTTFAWFTDEVKSGTNQIVAGNLDVELYHSNKVDTNEKVGNTTTLFDDVDSKKWEPGAMAWEKLTVANEGNLALKYELTLNVENATVIDGVSFASMLKVAVVDENFEYTREKVEAITDWKELATFVLEGEIKADANTNDDVPATATHGIIIWWEPSDNDNLFNMNNGKTVGSVKVDVGVHLFATQLASESDSFDNTYDEGAPALKWDGTTVEAVPEAVDNVITLTNPAQLAGFAEAVNAGNSYEGYTVKLGADMDLNNEKWTAIGDCESGEYFQGTFDGQGYTIYNLNVDYSTDTSEHATAGLFDWVDAAGATIKNVNIDGATVKGSHWTGVIAGYFTGIIENCSVNNATVTAYNLNDNANGDKVGGIVGCLNEHSYINNNTVTNSTITGNRDIGGIAGSVAASTYEMKNNKVENTTITYSTSKDYGSAGAIVSGRTGYTPDATNVATNVTIYHGTEVAKGIIETAANTYSIISKEGLMNLGELLPDWVAEVRRTVNLETDIDMSGETWAPLQEMFVNFNGNGHTISNLTVNGATDWANRSGFFAYLGGSTISDLTLKNVTSTGSQAGIFAGHSEAGNIINCKIEGTNIVTWDKPTTDKCGDGIGVFIGVSSDSCTCSATIAEGATVTLNKGNMSTSENVLAKSDIYVGGQYAGTQTIDVTNNGNIATVENGLGTDAQGNYYVYDANGLMAMREKIGTWGADTLAGKSINIMADIDATGKTWETATIQSGSSARNGFTFNGNGHTISNLTITGGETAGTGLFATNSGNSTPTTFKDITFDNVTVNGGVHTGILWGQMYGKLVVDNVSVTDSSVTGTCNVGALVGRNGDDGASEITFIDCSVKNTKVTASGTTGTDDKCGASAFLGMALKVGVNGVSVNLKFEGNNVSEGNTLTTADDYRGGGIYACANYGENSWATPVVVADFDNYNNNN